MRLLAALAIALFIAEQEASAQSASVAARIGAGQTARVSAAPIAGEGVLLEFALPGGRTQSFPQLGSELVAIDGRPDGSGLLARDLNGDGVDEVIIRGLVPPQRGAVLVFRWERATGEFAPVEFTNDRDQTTKYLVVDARLPVVFDTGVVEAHYESARPDGRRSGYVARYRWTDKGFTQSADN